MLYDAHMPLPQGWEIVPGEQPSETGQSWVFKVHRVGEADTFALKRLKNSKNKHRRERFVREVSTMESLRDQGIALPEIVEHDLELDPPYFVMPWYEEGSLESKVADRSYAEAPLDGLELLIRIAYELERLHAADFAHRDLKPANILLSKEGPLLADFGLCLPIDEEAARLTMTAEAIGSRFYIAPENESGMNESVDQRPADFYAFAKVLWALLAGRTPPARELVGSPELRLERVLDDARFAILDTLLDDLLNTDPRVRLADWRVVIDELEAFRRVLSGIQSSSKPGDLKDAMRLAQRLGQSPSVQSLSQQRTSEQRMRDWATSQVVGRLMQEASTMSDELSALTKATNGTVDFQVSTAGIDMQTLIGVEPRFSFPEYGSDMTVLGSSGAFVLLTMAPIADLNFPALYLGLFLLHRDAKFWILRAPVLPHSPGGLPESAIARYHSVLGPLPMMRQSSLDRSLEFLRETMELFRDMAHRYLFVLTNEQDVQDDRAWRD
jgi:serine/threonine protein kinase